MRKAWLWILLALGGCSGNDAQNASAEQVVKPDSPEALQAKIGQIVQKAQAKDEAAVLSLLEPYFLTREEILNLFGAEKGERAWLGYNDAIAADLRNEAPKVLIDQVSKGLTEVTVEFVGPAYPDRTTPGDQRLLDFMQQKLPMYTVRLHKPEEKLGLRLNGFVYINGQWRGLFKTYDYLPGGLRLESADVEEDESDAEEAPVESDEKSEEAPAEEKPAEAPEKP